MLQIVISHKVHFRLAVWLDRDPTTIMLSRIGFLAVTEYQITLVGSGKKK